MTVDQNAYCAMTQSWVRVRLKKAVRLKRLLSSEEWHE